MAAHSIHFEIELSAGVSMDWPVLQLVLVDQVLVLVAAVRIQHCSNQLRVEGWVGMAELEQEA